MVVLDVLGAGRSRGERLPGFTFLLATMLVELTLTLFTIATCVGLVMILMRGVIVLLVPAQRTTA